jgi:hypothetical protein
MPRPDPFQAQWQVIAGWDWERLERALTQQIAVRVCPAFPQQRASFHPAEAAPEDVRPGTPAVLAPEDIRTEIRLDAPPDALAPLSPQSVERELYFAAALHAHCQQRGLMMAAEGDLEGSVWICVKRAER